VTARTGRLIRVARVTRVLVNLTLTTVTLVCAAFLVPTLFGYDRYVITGGSMSGTFEKGSVAFERQMPVADLAVGDVITYLPPPDSGVTTLVTHRIVSKRAGRDGSTVLRTRGDANADVDPWTFSLTDRTQPVVEFTVPALGQVLVALADRETRMVLVGIPAALVALASLVQLVRALGPRSVRT
jgi:signal peptidase